MGAATHEKYNQKVTNENTRTPIQLSSKDLESKLLLAHSIFQEIITSDVVFDDVLGLEDRLVKSLALALLGLFGFYVVLGSRTLHFQISNLATCFRSKASC